MRIVFALVALSRAPVARVVRGLLVILLGTRFLAGRFVEEVDSFASSTFRLQAYNVNSEFDPPKKSA